MRRYLTYRLFFCLLVPFGVSAQRYVTANGEARFSSETPVEDIEATNKKSQVIFQQQTGEIAARIPIRDFVFPNKLMQEHFNENYMESDKYPVATFTGKLVSVPELTGNNPIPVIAKGKLTIHGVTKERELKGTISSEDNALTFNCEFDVALADHQIEVPKLVFVKIAQVVKVTCSFRLTPEIKK
jgi:polyisoprenoid-binding protein YceI